MKRPEVYRIFGIAPWGPFSVHPACYGKGTHPYVIDVAAFSIRQAYALASRGVWAADARGVGIRERWGPEWAPERAAYLERAA